MSVSSTISNIADKSLKSIRTVSSDAANAFKTILSNNQQDSETLEKSISDNQIPPPGLLFVDSENEADLVEYTLPDGQSVWRSINQAFEDIISSKIAPTSGSDNETLDLHNNAEIPRRFLKFEKTKEEIKSNDNQGAWFPYLLKETVPMDLTKYGIYKRSQLPAEVVPNCFTAIFKDHPKHELLLCEHSGKYINQSELKTICSLMGIKIMLHKWRGQQRKVVPYGEGDDVYNISLVANHYFLYEETEYQAIWFKNMLSEHDHSKGRIRKDSPKIKSLQLVSELVKNKSKCLDDFDREIYRHHNHISYQLDIENPIVDLEMENNIPYKEFKRGPTFKVDGSVKTGFVTKFYADIETNTTGNHEPYLFVIQNEETGKVDWWSGKDCVKRGLKYVSFRKKPLLYFHNLGYDSKFIIEHLDRPTVVDLSMSKCISITGLVNGCLITFHDTLAFISCSLSKFRDMFSLEEGKYAEFPHDVYKSRKITDRPHIKSTDYLKEVIPAEYHKDGVTYHMKYALDYCKMDVKVLNDGFKIFKGWIKDELDIDIDYILTSASLAHHYMAMKGCYEGVRKISGVSRAYMQKSVIGGRTMISLDNNYKSCVKECNEPIYDFDAVSLYPSAMMRMKGNPLGAPKLLKIGEDLDKLDDYYITIVITKVGIKLKIPCMSIIDECGSRVWTNDVVGKSMVVNKITLEDYVKYHQIEYNVIYGLKFDEGYNTKMVETMKGLFDIRKQLKKSGNPAEQVYKLIMNSAYGKTIERPHSEYTSFIHEDSFKDFIRKKSGSVIEFYKVKSYYRIKHAVGIIKHATYPHVGSSILSMSKRIMNEVFSLAQNEIYYTDTDSMLITNTGLEFIKKVNPDLVGDGPSQFHIDFNMKGENVVGTRGLFLAPKTYCVELTNDEGDIEYHTRMKGISKNAIDDKLSNFNNILDMFQYLRHTEITFNLLANDKIRFKFSGDLTVKTMKAFDRCVGPFL